MKKIIKVKPNFKTSTWEIKKPISTEVYEFKDVQLRMDSCILKNEKSGPCIECNNVIISGHIGIKLDSTIIKYKGGNWKINNDIVDDKEYESIVSLGIILFMS